MQCSRDVLALQGSRDVDSVGWETYKDPFMGARDVLPLDTSTMCPGTSITAAFRPIVARLEASAWSHEPGEYLPEKAPQPIFKCLER